MTNGVIRKLQKIVGERGILFRPEDLMLYEYDGSVDKAQPDCVVFPSTTAQVVDRKSVV